MIVALLAVLGVDLVVIVWTRAPFLLRNELLPSDGLAQVRAARPGEIKLLLGPYRSPEGEVHDATTA